MNILLVIGGLILILCGLKCISYAVDRNKIIFVFFAIILQTIGVAALVFYHQIAMKIM